MARGGGRATPRSVRVYTVNDESRYVIAHNIPTIETAVDEALKRLSLYGDIQAHRVLPQTSGEQAAFTESLWIQYETVNNARHAKNKAKLKPVLGSVLHVTYAPQDETPEDTAQKLRERREMIERRAAPRPPPQRHSGTTRHDAEAVSSEFIGPQLPSPSYRAPVMQATSTSLLPRAVDRSKRRRI